MRITNIGKPEVLKIVEEDELVIVYKRVCWTKLFFIYQDAACFEEEPMPMGLVVFCYLVIDLS